MDQREVSERRERRRGLKAAYGDFFDDVVAILYRHDPEGINFESNTDEYELEAGTIIPRLDGCTSTEDVQRLVHEEFRKWFSPGVTQPFETFRQPAEDIWQAWTKFREKGGPA
jgi:hypothetical protein